MAIHEIAQYGFLVKNIGELFKDHRKIFCQEPLRKET
jgi:hypothetical protein